MGTRRPLDPLAPLSPNVIGVKYSYTLAKANAPDGFHAMAERVLDEGTQGSGSASTLSGLTDLDNDTDEFGRQLIRHARDERRMNDALRGNTQPFRKARPHPRVGLTLENLERNNVLNQSPPRQNRFTSPGSVSDSGGSEPPLHIPREWGRKGRHKNDWLRRINAVDEVREPVAQDDNPGAVIPRKTSYTGDFNSNNVDWSAAAADIPLPSMENSPLSHRVSQRGTPGPVRDHSASLDRIRQWEITEDLTVGSLLASTPAVVKKKTALDEIRRRELETIKERAVTTSRLDRISEQTPEERRRQRSSSRHSASSQPRNEQEALSQSWTHPAEQEITVPKRTDGIRNMQEPPPIAQSEAEGGFASPTIVHKSSETVGVVDRGIRANTHTNPQRPGHHRQDSLPLLRRLARAASGSPTPKRGAEGSGSAQTPETAGSKVASKPIPGVSSNQDMAQKPQETRQAEDSPGPDTATVTAAAEEPEPLDSVKLVEGGTIMANKLSIVTSLEERVTIRESVSARTPVVSGAWVDTPGPRTGQASSDSPSKSAAARRGSKSPSKNQPAQEPLQKPAQETVQGEGSKNPRGATREPSGTGDASLPSSALAAVVSKARSGEARRGSDELGDSTINSLEDIIAPTDDPSLTVDLDEDTTLPDLRRLPAGKPKTQAEEQRLQEVLALRSMNARLRAARTSLRDANRGMKRVEHQVDGVDGDGGAAAGPCKRCGCPAGGRAYASPISAAWTAFRGHFYNGRSRRRWGLTWLGLWCLLFWSWFITETVLCNAYCQPRYAHRMVGYGVNPDAPRLPFVTITMLFRPSRWLWRPVFRFIGMLYRSLMEDRSVRRAAVRTATTAVRHTTRALTQPTAEAELGMGDDEYV